MQTHVPVIDAAASAPWVGICERHAVGFLSEPLNVLSSFAFIAVAISIWRYYQKEEAERSVRNLTGVKGVSNLVAVRAQPLPSDIRQRIKDALQRGAEFDAERITVDIQGGKVILRGTVRSYAEMKDAERAARNAPGVTEVENRLTVDPSVFAAV